MICIRNVDQSFRKSLIINIRQPPRQRQRSKYHSNITNKGICPLGQVPFYFATCLLTHQMFDGCNWMVDNHSWPRPSHYYPDTLFHLRTIAMHRTFLAGGLLLAKTASVESAVGIVQQFLATWAQFVISFASPAIQTNHLLHHCLFFFNASMLHLSILQVLIIQVLASVLLIFSLLALRPFVF